MKIRPVLLQRWGRSVSLHSPPLDMTLSSNLEFHLSMNRLCPPPPSCKLSKLYSPSSILFLFPTHIPYISPCLTPPHKMFKVVQQHLNFLVGIRTAAGVLTWSIINVCMLHVVEEMCIACWRQEADDHCECAAHSFGKLFYFIQQTLMVESMREGVFSGSENKQQSEKESHSCRSGCSTMNQSKFTFEMQALFLKPRGTFVHMLSHSDICCGFSYHCSPIKAFW